MGSELAEACYFDGEGRWQVGVAHALRHSAATALADANVPMRVAQEILGHASIEMTANVYTRVLDDQLADAMAALDAHVGNTG